MDECKHNRTRKTQHKEFKEIWIRCRDCKMVVATLNEEVIEELSSKARA